MAAIRTTALRKDFGDVQAVADLDLTVESGEVFGFLGPNGAGKSTTINILLGFLRPSSGSVQVLGTDVTVDSLGVRRRTGLLPEGYEPYQNLTGREHVRSAIDTKGADDDPDVLLERVGLNPEAARRAAGGYSTGMQQRLALAIALVGDPELLILDEPSAGLDPDGVALLRDIVREESTRGATVFFSSHILEEVEKVCDRVAILDDGRLVAEDSIDGLRAELGAAATITVEFEDGAVTDDGLAAVRSVGGVDDVTRANEKVTVDVARPSAKMPALQTLGEIGTAADVQVEDASLEALFEAYTGERPEADANGGVS
ncbi:MAG: ABC transporter ATP-binding protein [Halobacteriaceae archaeon]